MPALVVQKVEDKSAKALPLFEEIEKRLEDVRRRAFQLFEGRGSEIGNPLEDWLRAEHEIMGWPAAELDEKDGKYELEMTLPGYDPSEVQVTATPSELIVHANAKREKKAEEGKCLWTEFTSNDVYRRFELPEAIDMERANATLDKGMLHVTAPKKPRAEAKPIEVRAA